MAQHRIGELHVDVDATAGSVPSSGDVRTYMTRVWTAVGDALEQRHPGRVYRVRTFEGRWQVTLAELWRAPDPALVAELAGLCAGAVPAHAGTHPDEAADVVCFAAEPERIAGWWLARAGDSGAPHWAWSDLEAAPSLEAVLLALTPSEREAVVSHAAQAPGAEPARLDRLAAVARAVAHSASAADPVPDVPDSDSAAAHAAAPVVPRVPPAPADAEAVRGRAVPGPVEPPGSPAGGRSSDPDAALGDPTATPDRSAAPSSSPRSTGSDRFLAAGSSGVFTSWGGLVHLLGPLLECGTGEALWETCLDERAVLARALRALCGDDPIATALGGVEPGTGPLTAPEPLAEVRARLFDALRRGVPRRGLAEWPPLVLAGDVLRAAELPWPVAAWTSEAQARAQASELASAAPGHGDGAWRPAEARAEDRVLLAVTVGVPATLLALRLEWRGQDADAFAARWWRLPAWIHDDGEVLTVRFGAEQVDLALRRCGADADPGWVPWLRRTVRVYYDVGEVV